MNKHKVVRVIPRPGTDCKVCRSSMSDKSNRSYVAVSNADFTVGSTLVDNNRNGSAFGANANRNAVSNNDNCSLVLLSFFGTTAVAVARLNRGNLRMINDRSGLNGTRI